MQISINNFGLHQGKPNSQIEVELQIDLKISDKSKISFL
jgi:hypothetical protein